MSNSALSQNDIAWEKLFKDHDILNQIKINGYFKISATQIKVYREPRLMAKFDHTINLPKIFSDNKLAILPISRGDYIISNFNAYHKFEPNTSTIKQVSLPSHIQSLDCNNVPSEAIALNSALASGIIADFMDDEEILSTVSGRMGSGVFDFNIKSSINTNACHIQVNNSQIEIDAAYEGVKNLALFEAKRDLSDDFLIRQLYYPYRVWENRVTKPVRPLYLVYSNGIYRLFEYMFEDPANYSSIVLVKQQNYSIEDTQINSLDIQNILHQVVCVNEPDIPFPQADSFERVINICELLNEQELSRNDVTEQYAFDVRQTNYYTDAARYLGLIEKRHSYGTPVYYLSQTGKKVLSLNFKQRQLALCNLILSHKAFKDTLSSFFEHGEMPSAKDIMLIMENSNLYKVESASTYKRRSSTIRGWLNWIVELIND